MMVNVIKSNTVETLEIPDVSSHLIKDNYISLIARVLGQNTRQGTKKAKTRSEVKGKSAKPYRQKGTGYARQGSRKAPHFRGGGVAHGPMPDYTKLRLNKKFKRMVLVNILKKYLLEGRLGFIDLSEGKDVRIFGSPIFEGRSLVVYDSNHKVYVNYLRNISNVDILPFVSLSPLLVLNYNNLYFDLNIKDTVVSMITGNDHVD
ncbi:MAG: 50S ribosomal protein L4 [Candidatus Dojkabacteria bacterium]|nr:MAG: 50S ribosomal protein L4 [Candidatus Dojkabacteria bacterium]